MNAVMLPNHTVFITDTYVNVDPTAEQIADIAILAAEVIRRFGIEPRVALLSHSSFGTGDDPASRKMREGGARHKTRPPPPPRGGGRRGAGPPRLATEIRHLQRTEVQEAEEPFGRGQKGSSAMPHKRNPIRCERIAGLARLLRAHALTGIENVALWHERDISHSSVERVVLPDACLVADYVLDLATRTLDGLLVYPDRMRRNLELTRGLVFSGTLLLELARAGLQRDDAYRLVQAASREAWENGRELREVAGATEAIREALGAEALARAFDLRHHLRHVDAIFDRTLREATS